MKLKLIAYFLTLLFMVVIAFPGYGIGVSSVKKNKTTLSDTHSEAPSWKQVLKKCLSKGINAIEEERSIEEDEVSEGGVVFFHPNHDPLTLIRTLYLDMHETHHWFESDSAISKIFSPPEQA